MLLALQLDPCIDLRDMVDCNLLAEGSATTPAPYPHPIPTLCMRQVSTWYVGLLGTGPLASAGVALSLFNSSTKLLNMPLLAVTTSSVAGALGAEQGAARGGRPAAAWWAPAGGAAPTSRVATITLES